MSFYLQPTKSLSLSRVFPRGCQVKVKVKASSSDAIVVSEALSFGSSRQAGKLAGAKGGCRSNEDIQIRSDTRVTRC